MREFCWWVVWVVGFYVEEDTMFAIVDSASLIGDNNWSIVCFLSAGVPRPSGVLLASSGGLARVGMVLNPRQRSSSPMGPSARASVQAAWQNRSLPSLVSTAEI